MAVTPELRLAVLERDGSCVLWKRDASHVCRDRWGEPHMHYDIRRLSIEHVKSELRAGKRAEDDMAHLVALCYGANIGVPSKAERAFMREYLRLVTA